jgi:hypothetical protein
VVGELLTMLPSSSKLVTVRAAFAGISPENIEPTVKRKPRMPSRARRPGSGDAKLQMNDENPLLTKVASLPLFAGYAPAPDTAIKTAAGGRPLNRPRVSTYFQNGFNPLRSCFRSLSP